METSITCSIIFGAAGLAATYYYAWHSKKIEQEKMQKELFKEFNERYKELNDDLVAIEKICEQPGFSADTYNLEGALRQRVIEYFSLCAEEYYWAHHKKRIDPLIWESWQEGMNYWYKLPPIEKLWKDEIAANGKKSYYITDGKGFFIAAERSQPIIKT